MTKEEQFILDNYLTIPIKSLVKILGKSKEFVRLRLKRFNLVIPHEIIEQRKKDSYFKKGRETHNKGLKMSAEQYAKCSRTFFKKGHIPKLSYSENGVITHRKDKNSKEYKFIRISLGNWQLLHQYEYELKHGKVPNGYCLWFKDGNSLNVIDSNIELISRAENVKRNRKKYLQYPDDIKNSQKLLNKLNKELCRM